MGRAFACDVLRAFVFEGAQVDAGGSLGSGLEDLNLF